MTMLPPAPGKCPECAAEHGENEPHNADSIFYQLKFQAEHGRSPTWRDATAHMTEEDRKLWVECFVRLLKAHRQQIPAELAEMYAKRRAVNQEKSK
jgi:hypothetical protein